MLLYKYIIKLKDIEKLISFSDNEKYKKDFLGIKKNIRSGFTVIIFLNIIGNLVALVFLLNIELKYFSFESLTFQGLVVLSALNLLVNFYICNKYIYYSGNYLEDGILGNILPTYSQYLKKNKRLITDFTANFKGYFLNIDNFSWRLLEVVVVFSSILLLNKSKYSGLLLLLILSVFILIFLGKKWTETFQAIFEKHKKGEEVPRKLLSERVFYPTIYNSFVHLVPTLGIAVFGLLGLSYQLAVVTLLSNISSFFWSFINKLQSFRIAKESLVEMNEILEKLQDKYVINNRSFHQACKNCIPSEEVKKKSQQNKSLVLKSFVPKPMTNQKQQFKREFTYEFKPGTYQINGINGVGKTTFLSSLSLPENELVEIPKGEVALAGELFYNPEDELSEHRNKFYYLGGSSSQSDIKDIDTELFEKYDGISRIINSILTQDKEKYSEGEKAVLLICNAYQKIQRGDKTRLVIIDEILSRIYNGADIPVREEVIDLVSKMRELNEDLILIVVDHTTKISGFKQLYLKESEITSEV